MRFSDRDYLFEMMLAMNEVESAPLVDAERAEDHVACASLIRTEELLALCAQIVDPMKMLCRCLGKFSAG